MRGMSRRVFGVGLVGALGLLAAWPATAQKTDQGPADGHYSGGDASWALRVIVQGNQATASVGTQRCIGEIDGAITNRPDGSWSLNASQGSYSCQVDFTPVGVHSYQMQEGRGCFYWHGAACEFTGQVTRTGQ